MKLNYRDKIIAAVLIALAIFAIFFFALIKPKRKDIKAHEKTLSEVKKTKADIESKIKEIPGLQEAILSLYDKTSDITKNFIPVDQVKDTLVVDKFMQKFADDSMVRLKTVTLQNAKVAPIDYYYKDNKDSLDEMRTAADIDGSLASDYNATLEEQNALSQRAKENVIQSQYGITIEGTKFNTWKYLEALKNFDKNLVVNSVSIGDYTFGKSEAEKANITLPETENGEEFSVRVGDQEIKNTSTTTIIVTLYSVYEMSKPDVETVPSN